MVRKRLKINWENNAKLQLKEACAYIKRSSFQNAQKVKNDILDAITALSLHPTKYAQDKYKISNDGSYRAFELHHYRIIYMVLQDEVKVMNVRHTCMNPMEY